MKIFTVSLGKILIIQEEEACGLVVGGRAGGIQSTAELPLSKVQNPLMLSFRSVQMRPIVIFICFNPFMKELKKMIINICID